MQRAVDAKGRPDWGARATALRLKIQLGLVSKESLASSVVSVSAPIEYWDTDGEDD